MKIMAIVKRHGLPLTVSAHAVNHHEVQQCFDFSSWIARQLGAWLSMSALRSGVQMGASHHGIGYVLGAEFNGRQSPTIADEWRTRLAGPVLLGVFFNLMFARRCWLRHVPKRSSIPSRHLVE
jgi:hypothetical protein